MNKPTLIDALRAFIESRPGFEPCNYPTLRDYRADQRHATRQLHDARHLLAYVAVRDSITAEMLLAGLRSGRLTWDEASGQLDYCTGQYYPTEFRGAACRMLAGVIWDWMRDYCVPPPVTGERLRSAARRDLGGLARRWLD